LGVVSQRSKFWSLQRPRVILDDRDGGVGRAGRAQFSQLLHRHADSYFMPSISYGWTAAI
jgi:hypothetical protein